MAKLKRLTIGSICKPQDETKSVYIKLRGDTIDDFIEILKKANKKDGMYLNLESQKDQLASLDTAVKNGKLTEEIATKIRTRVEKIPAFVRYEIVALSGE